MELLKKTTELEEKIEKFDDSIFLNVGTTIKKIALNSILFIQAYGDYMKVKCEDASYVVHIRMKQLEEQLPSKDFCRIHRSYLVRLDKIDQVYTKSLEIGKVNIPIGKTNKEDLMKLLPLIR